jgi:hypothetical protein
LEIRDKMEMGWHGNESANRAEKRWILISLISHSLISSLIVNELEMEMEMEMKI